MGRKSRKKRSLKQISPIKENKLEENFSTVQSIQPAAQINSPYIKIFCPAAGIVSVIFFNFGAIGMSTYSELAPWLMAIGALMAVLAILTTADIWNFMTIHITKNWQRGLIIFIVCCLFFIPTLIASKNVINHEREVLSKTPIFYGELTPSNEPNPPSPSYSYAIPSADYFRIMFGDDSGIWIDGPVDNTFMLKGKPFLTINTAPDGTILFNTEVLDSTNHKIIKIIDNEFQANPEYAFRPQQPDKHSLIVRDSDGIEVLNIKYINSKTLWISGRFFIPQSSEYVTILPSGLIEFPGFQIKNFYGVIATGTWTNLG